MEEGAGAVSGWYVRSEGKEDTMIWVMVSHWLAGTAPLRAAELMCPSFQNFTKEKKIYRESKTLKRFYSVYIKKIAAICTCSSFMPYQECHCGSLTPPPQSALMTYRLSQRYINWTNIWRALQDIERVKSRGIHLYSVWIMIHRLSTCCD